MAKSRNWIFTINNPEFNFLPLQFVNEDEFVVWQLETGECGTPHLQGYLEFKEPKRLAGMKKLCQTAHWEVRNGSQQQAVDYCTKDDTRSDGPWCFGDLKAQGQRTDLEDMRTMMKSGATLDDVKDSNFGLYCRTKHAIDSEYQIIRAQLVKESVLARYDTVEWKPWQQTIVDLVDTVPDRRTVHWYYEGFGNVGKS